MKEPVKDEEEEKKEEDEGEEEASAKKARLELQADRVRRREEKAAKRAAREAAKVQNAKRCDARPQVRLAAAAAVAAAAPAVESDSAAVAQAPQASQTKLGPPEVAQAAGPAAQAGAAGPSVVSLFGLDLQEFSLDLLPASWASLRSLDLSHNLLTHHLPGLERLTSLIELDLCRNDLRSLPAALPQLQRLAKLNLSRNDLKPSLEFLQTLLRPGLPSLQELDLTFNRKIYTQAMLDMFVAELPDVSVRMTVTCPPPEGAKVGEAACERDPTLLRSQLEPYTTQQLRRRLVEAFGEEKYDQVGQAPPPPRAEVMQRMLEHYARAGVREQRRLVRVEGKPVASEMLDELLLHLRAWAERSGVHQERPMIDAKTYMILRSPAEFETRLNVGSRKAHSAKRRYEQNEELWSLAASAMASVDPAFASEFTGLAVTRGFRGSPHIDTTNVGPFYGLALGDFADGTGGIQVELDAMTVAQVNTKGRLGKVDGRFPHWVAPYDETCERFSLIFYQTEGEVKPQTSAVFGPIVDE